MQTYIGTKVVKAEPMNSLQFEVFKGYIGRRLEDKGEYEEGYRVEYENGHVSWSPKDVFEKTYVGLNESILTAVSDTAKKICEGTENGKVDLDINSILYAGLKLGMSFAKKDKVIYGCNLESDLLEVEDKRQYMVQDGCGNVRLVDITVTTEDTAESIFKKIDSKTHITIRKITRL